ncbi:SUF system Fe-S cluster assembly protein [Gammaproteobacteria bacterium]|nr:SUF system Fe-S cluster assembly protein [Gammaproteobacteria bacterium]
MNNSKWNATAHVALPSLNRKPTADAAAAVEEDPNVDLDTLKERVIRALKGIYDPEIPINIYDLGLIYDVRINEDREVDVDMTLTSPGCPVAQTFPGQVEYTVRLVSGVSDARVELVWDPPWSKERMSEAALLELGLF